LLVYYGKFGYQEARTLPVNLRRFFIEEISKEIKKQNGTEEAEDKPLSDSEKMMLRSKLNQSVPQDTAKKPQDIRNLESTERTKHMSFEPKGP